MRNVGGGSSVKKGYPPSMRDVYQVSSPNIVPSDRERPWYVGKRPQNHPPLDGPI